MIANLSMFFYIQNKISVLCEEALNVEKRTVSLTTTTILISPCDIRVEERADILLNHLNVTTGVLPSPFL